MQLKIIQINILKGKFLDRLVDFLRREQPDIITMQEVTGGAENLWSDKSVDIFIHCKEALHREGIVVPEYHLTHDAQAYSGNALFVRGTILYHEIVWLRPYRDYDRTDQEADLPDFPRSVLNATVDIDGYVLHVLSTHGAWGVDPVDTPEKIRQADILAGHLRSLGANPFVLGGDFNMQSGSGVISRIDAVARNIIPSSVRNTLNFRTHYAAARLGKGLAVDFLYTSKHFKVVSIDTPDVDVSDHFPVRAVLTL